MRTEVEQGDESIDIAAVREIWELLDASRGSRSLATLHCAELLDLADAHDIRLTYSELRLIASRLSKGGVEGFVPPLVSGFISELVKGTKAAKVLDPCMGYGSLLGPLVHALEPDEFVGLEDNPDALVCARRMLPNRGSVSGRPDWQDLGLQADQKFDLIVSAPPFGVRVSEPIQCGEQQLRGDAALHLLMASARHLEADGRIVFVLSPAFFSSQAVTVSNAGLQVEAAFLLPSGTFSRTLIESYVVVFKRQQQSEQIFVGDASEDGRVLENYFSRTDSGDPRLGTLVELGEFRGLPPLVSKETLERMGSRTGLERSLLGDLAEQISRCSDGLDPGTGENVLFIRGARPIATTDPEALPPKPKDWFKIPLDPERADARVAASYLKGPLGQHAFGSLSLGSVVSRLRADDVANLVMFLPPAEEHAAVVDLDRKLNAVAREIEELRSELWRAPGRRAEIESSLGRVNHGETFEAWLDTLPFPLASVLWAFHTSRTEPLRAYQLLHHFFEALTQFLATVVMSGVRTNDQLFLSEWETVRRTIDGQGLSVKRPSFATWVIIYERLSKLIRAGLNDGSADMWRRMFVCDDDDLLDALVSKRMVSLVKRANKLRNRWQGHGGVVGDLVARQRMTRYQEMVDEFRGMVGTRWASYPLVLAGRSGRGEVLYNAEALMVMGSRTPFERTHFEVYEPPYEGHLHMMSPVQGRWCRLLPLVQLGPTSAEQLNACYFFNGVVDETPKFVSYHSVERPEVQGGPTTLAPLLTEIA